MTKLEALKFQAESKLGYIQSLRQELRRAEAQYSKLCEKLEAMLHQRDAKIDHLRMDTRDARTASQRLAVARRWLSFWAITRFSDRVVTGISIKPRSYLNPVQHKILVGLADKVTVTKCPWSEMPRCNFGTRRIGKNFVTRRYVFNTGRRSK